MRDAHDHHANHDMEDMYTFILQHSKVIPLKQIYV